MRLGSDTIVIRRAPLVADDYGNENRDWANAVSSAPVNGCNLQPLSVTEVTVGRETLVSRWQLFAPPATDLLATDRVVHDTATYEVDGEPQRWGRAPRGHIAAVLRKVT